jgi:3-phosphoshikimate 1-carboxyvinyltransferase
MNITVRPSTLSGRIEAPGSKSHMQRLLVAALLCPGRSTIHRPAENDDCRALLSCVAALGADIEIGPDPVTGHERLEITGGLAPRTDLIDVGESGLGARILAPIAALAFQPGQPDRTMKIAGRGTLLARPMDAWADILPALGAQVQSNNGRLPLQIQGPLLGGDVRYNGSLSSQFTTGLLMALPCAPNDSVLEVENLSSRPYIEMTLHVMAEAGIEVKWEQAATDDNTTDGGATDGDATLDRFRIRGGQTYLPTETTVAGDWSAGATWLILASLAGDETMVVDRLEHTPEQADRSVQGALLFSGVKLMRGETGIQVDARKKKGFKFDARHCPDLIPVLSAYATFCKGPSYILGRERLRHKESDRALAIVEEFAKAGIHVEIDSQADALIIHPNKGKTPRVQPATLDARGDHRMVMAAAILGTQGAPITIVGAEAVAKSYPHFFEDLEAAGGLILRPKPSR